ncbi:MAG: MBL fold metallo-hydrolase [Methanobacteriota archaeon]|nr:MAG: MBL fold metallo-hydrolase [Euryarchaeota archaeon]
MKAPRVARRAMLVEKVVAPPLDNNAYLIVDETSKQAAVVDPALGGQQLLAKADELGAKVVLILNTHGHVDATADDGSIRTATGAKIAIFELDGARLEKNARDTRWFLPAPPPPVKADVQLKEGSELKLGDLVIRTLHTPGHTEGSACFYVESAGALFTGDTLYAGSCGRTDVFGGSPAKMIFSLRRIKELPPETHVYPGHGPETDLGDETWIRDLTYPIV